MVLPPSAKSSKWNVKSLNSSSAKKISNGISVSTGSQLCKDNDCYNILFIAEVIYLQNLFTTNIQSIFDSTG